jgi:hypothetical protein
MTNSSSLSRASALVLLAGALVAAGVVVDALDLGGCLCIWRWAGRRWRRWPVRWSS